MPTTKSTKPIAPWPASRAYAPIRCIKNFATLPSSTAPTTKAARLKRRCAARKFRTKSRAGKAFSTAQKSKTCAPGFACSPIRTTTPPFCAPSPAPDAALATPRSRNWASLPTATKSACSKRCFRPRCPRPCPSARLIACTPLAASSTIWNFGRATPPAPKPPKRFWTNGCATSALKNTCTTAKTAKKSPLPAGATCSNFATGWPGAAAARSTTPQASPCKAKAKACSKWRKTWRCWPPSANVAKTKTSSPSPPCTPPRGWNGRMCCWWAWSKGCCPSRSKMPKAIPNLKAWHSAFRKSAASCTWALPAPNAACW